jgi:transketolase
MLKILRNYRNIITVEDHSTIGGLGSVVAEILARNKLNKKFKIHGIKDDFVDSDTPSSLEKFYKLDIKNLEKIFKNFFKL